MRIDSTLQHRLTALVADEGLDLVATEVVGAGSKTILRLVVDGPDGVTLDQCAAVSREASAMLDVEDPIVHQYTLEVSSPGLDRKLYSAEDFDRFVGQRIKVRMKPSYREHRTVTGELITRDGEQVRVRAENGEEAELPLDEVFEARLEVDWKSILKKGKNRP